MHIQGREIVASDAPEQRSKRTGTLLLVLVLLAAAGWAGWRYDVAGRLGFSSGEAAPEAIAPPPGLDLPTAAPAGPVAATAAPGAPDADKVRAVLAPLLKDRRLGKVVVAAVADVHGNPVFAGGTAPATDIATPASTTKLLTGAAALASLGPDHTFRTRVVEGAPGEVVLVGGGDPYLSQAPTTDDVAPANLRALARATAAKLRAAGTPRVTLGFDDSWFSGPTTHPDWPADYMTDGDVAPITALWVDQGMEADGDGAETDPSATAADAFAAELRKAGIKVAGSPRRTTAPAAAQELAGADSAPVGQIVEEVLRISDNEGAEVLAHQVAIAEGRSGSFADGSTATLAVLRELGVPTDRDVLRDGSGLSRSNRLTTATLLGVLALGTDPAHPELRMLTAGLPVAGFTGSLALRYTEGEEAGRGRVRAKTGTLSGVHGLAGVVTTPDGTQMLFVFLANKVAEPNTLHARERLDELTAALGACACRRSV